MKTLLLAIASLLWMAAPAAAQGATAVVEVGTVLFESIAQTIHAAETVRQGLQELAPLEGLLIADGYHQDLAALTEVISGLEGLSWDAEASMQQFDALFGSDAIPETMEGYAARRRETRALIVQSYRSAVRSQSLMGTLASTATHLLNLLNQVTGVSGNLSALQTIAQQLAKLGQVATESQVSRLAFERAKAIEAADEIAADEAAVRINERFFQRAPERR